MVTRKNTYLCDICCTEYTTKTEANSCEKRGRIILPTGTIFRSGLNFCLVDQPNLTSSHFPTYTGFYYFGTSNIISESDNINTYYAEDSCINYTHDGIQKLKKVCEERLEGDTYIYFNEQAVPYEQYVKIYNAREKLKLI